MNSRDNTISSFEWYSIFGILALVALIYSPIVTNSFNGDDFVHLKWLHQAVSQPELIWRNFHSSWLDLTTAKFYRPLISIFMLTDYLIWHGNGIGFHLTNLFCHLANTLLLWLVLKNILASQFQTKSLNYYIWCLSAAALFGLYPLHAEAVDWITGRVDLFVTLFFLGAFASYLRWRQTNKYQWLSLSIISFICSLLSKEMAIMLPPVIFMYEFILGARLWENSSETKETVFSVDSIKRAVKLAFRQSVLFWLILIAYVIWRAYALGTFIGGYDSTVLPQNWQLLVYLWKHSLYMLFIPFNQSLLTNGKSIVFLWVALLFLSLALSIRQMLSNIEIKNRFVFGFLCIWLVLNLVPVVKLFNIGPDLQGSRLAYLATVPLCMLICFGLASVTRQNNKTAYWQIGALTVLLSAAGAGLLINNIAWVKAGAASQALMQQLNEISKTNPANAVIYIVGLPDQIDGAYVCRNAIDGMTKYPQVAKDIHNCFNLGEIDHIFPFGFALNSMTNTISEGSGPKFYIWHAVQQKLEKFNLPNKSSTPLKVSWSGNNLQADMSSFVVNKSCIDMDFLAINTDLVKQNQFHKRPSLVYKNDLNPEGISIQALPMPQQDQMIFPLHAQVDWILGGKCSDIILCAPETKIYSAGIIPTNQLMPILSFKGSNNQYIIGYIEIDQSRPSCQISYDASKMAEAKNVILELTPPNQTFIIPNNPVPEFPESASSPKKLSGLSGSISLTRADFPGPGIYALRLRALRGDNSYIGLAGDHIIVTVK